MLNGAWSNDSRLSELKTELASVERKIELSLTPETKGEPEEQTEQQKVSPKSSGKHCKEERYSICPDGYYYERDLKSPFYSAINAVIWFTYFSAP